MKLDQLWRHIRESSDDPFEEPKIDKTSQLVQTEKTIHIILDLLNQLYNTFYDLTETLDNQNDAGLDAYVKTVAGFASIERIGVQDRYVDLPMVRPLLTKLPPEIHEQGVFGRIGVRRRAILNIPKFDNERKQLTAMITKHNKFIAQLEREIGKYSFLNRQNTIHESSENPFEENLTSKQRYESLLTKYSLTREMLKQFADTRHAAIASLPDLDPITGLKPYVSSDNHFNSMSTEDQQKYTLLPDSTTCSFVRLRDGAIVNRRIITSTGNLTMFPLPRYVLDTPHYQPFKKTMVNIINKYNKYVVRLNDIVTQINSFAQETKQPFESIEDPFAEPDLSKEQLLRHLNESIFAAANLVFDAGLKCNDVLERFDKVQSQSHQRMRAYYRTSEKYKFNKLSHGDMAYYFIFDDIPAENVTYIPNEIADDMEFDTSDLQYDPIGWILEDFDNDPWWKDYFAARKKYAKYVTKLNSLIAKYNEINPRTQTFGESVEDPFAEPEMDLEQQISHTEQKLTALDDAYYKTYTEALKTVYKLAYATSVSQRLKDSTGTRYVFTELPLSQKVPSEYIRGPIPNLTGRVESSLSKFSPRIRSLIDANFDPINLSVITGKYVVLDEPPYRENATKLNKLVTKMVSFIQKTIDTQQQLMNLYRKVDDDTDTGLFNELLSDFNESANDPFAEQPQSQSTLVQAIVELAKIIGKDKQDYSTSYSAVATGFQSEHIHGKAYLPMLTVNSNMATSYGEDKDGNKIYTPITLQPNYDKDVYRQIDNAARITGSSWRKVFEALDQYVEDFIALSINNWATFVLTKYKDNQIVIDMIKATAKYNRHSKLLRQKLLQLKEFLDNQSPQS